MLLFELEKQPDFASKLVVLTNQLKQNFEENGYPQHFTVDHLLAYFAKYDLILDINDLYNMIQVPPLKDLISNIQGKNVVFVGQTGEKPEVEIPDQEKDDIVKKMADRAMKRK